MIYILKTENAAGNIIFSAAVFLLLIGLGCSAGGQKISEEMTRSFESYQVLPDHRYYQIGWDTRVHAIIALKDPYHITSELWLQFDANPETLQLRVDALEIYDDRGYDRIYGYHLLDNAGNHIGAWYSSIYVFTATVNDVDNNVVISMDKPWVTP